MSVTKHDRIVPGCIFACLIAALSLSGAAYAGCISQTFSNTAHYNCDGKSGTSRTVGVHSGSLFNNS